MTLREQAPELWASIVGWCREIGIEWPEDDIAHVIGKVLAPTPDDLPDTIGRVLEYCRAAEKSGDDEAVAAVELWRQLPSDIIEITIGDDGSLNHRLNPDMQFELRVSE